MSHVYRLSIPYPDRYDLDTDTYTFLFKKRPSKEKVIEVLSYLTATSKDAWIYASMLSLIKRTELPVNSTYRVTTEVYTNAGPQPGIIKLERVEVF